MLSPHEFAALVLVKYAERIADIDQSDLRTLLDRKLVEIDDVRVCARMQPRLTDQGRALLAQLHVNR